MEDDGGLLILLFSYHFFSSLFFTHICCGVFFLHTLFCRLSVVWIDSCTGSTKYKNERTKPRQPNQPAKQKSRIWIVGCLVICCPKKWQRYVKCYLQIFPLSYPQLQTAFHPLLQTINLHKLNHLALRR